MTTHPHLEALRTRHRDLDRRISSEERRPAAGDQEIQGMKRERLRLKEEITRFETSLSS